MAAFGVTKHGGGTVSDVVNRQNERERLPDRNGTVQAGAVEGRVARGEQFSAVGPRAYRSPHAPREGTHHAERDVYGASTAQNLPLRPVEGASSANQSPAKTNASNSQAALVWSVGMTTAPRSRPTLERSLTSLAAAGWGEPRLFAEPRSRVPPKFEHLPITWRDAKLGAFPNWYLGLAELYFRQPSADAYLMCQDDALFAEGSRAYLETRLWPADELGLVSIYTPSHASAGRARGFHVERRGWATWGALAYVFPNNSLRALLAHPIFTHHRRQGHGGGLRNIDSVVGAWCLAAELPYYIHVPSLVQHVGETSTIWTGGGALGRRRASDFVDRIN